MKFVTLTWTGYVGRMQVKRNVYAFLIGKYLGQQALEDRRGIIIKWIVGRQDVRTGYK
jgi:hypothetical protein